MSTTPEQSKLYLSPKQYQDAQEHCGSRGEHLRLGQWLVNLYGEPGISYPHIFYLDDPDKTWAHVEVVKEVPRCITIEVEGGAVTSVTGLPEDYAYEIIDHDNH